MKNKIHKFEQAGLGKAPFKVVSSYEHHEHLMTVPGSIPVGDYGTNCDYCMQYIRIVFVIQSSDGKQFKVGSTCVNKTGDIGMIKVVKEKLNERQRIIREEKRRAEYEKTYEAYRKAELEWKQERERRRQERISTVKNEYNRLASKLEKQPHPKPYFARQGKTMKDYVDYFLKPDNQWADYENSKVIEILKVQGANI